MIPAGLRAIPTTTLPTGEPVPRLGQGTWRMGERPASRAAEVAALRLGLDLGLTLIDTAEMYGEGGAEEVVGEAVRGRRDGVFLVTKVYPYNAGRRRLVAACERSLRRLGTDRIDLYLLHWPGAVPLEETVEAFGGLAKAGKIRHWGVSNFDAAGMARLWTIPDGPDAVTDQVCYSPTCRGIEWDLAPWCRRHGLPVMAYTPLDDGRLLLHPAIEAIAARYHASPAQIVLAWLLDREGVIAIPKAANPKHVRENRGAAGIAIEEADRAQMDRAFPPPAGPSPLLIL